MDIIIDSGAFENIVIRMEYLSCLERQARITVGPADGSKFSATKHGTVHADFEGGKGSVINA